MDLRAPRTPHVTCGHSVLSHQMDRVPPEATGSSVHVPPRDTTSLMPTAAREPERGGIAPLRRPGESNGGHTTSYTMEHRP